MRKINTKIKRKIRNRKKLKNVNSNKKKAYNVNFIGTKNLLDLVSEYEVNWFFFASTSHVYSSKNNIILRWRLDPSDWRKTNNFVFKSKSKIEITSKSKNRGANGGKDEGKDWGDNLG